MSNGQIPKHAMFNVTCNNCHGGNSSSDVKETAHMGITGRLNPQVRYFTGMFLKHVAISIKMN